MKLSLLILVIVFSIVVVHSSETAEKAEAHSDLELSEEEPIGAENADAAETVDDGVLDANAKEEEAVTADTPKTAENQTGPLIDIFGPSLLSLEMIDESHAQLVGHQTNEILGGKKVIGLYFSADWCGPCRQFTPELVSFYSKMNARKGKTDQFEIVWVSRCRDLDSFGQYFTHMKWLALPPEEAMGARGQMLSDKYKVKGIPSLVLIDESGNTITTDARNKIPQDKAGIGFPWRNPLATVYMTILPKSLRLMLKSQLSTVKKSAISKIKSVIGMKAAAA